MGRFRSYRRLARSLASCRQSATRRFRYHRNRRRHLRLYEPDASRAPDQEVLASFIEHGATIVRGFLPFDVVQQIVAEVRQSVEAVAEDRYTGPLRTLNEQDTGLFRIYGIEESLSPSSRAFFESSFIADLADSICRTGMHSFDRYIDYKAKIDGRDKNLAYHIDHWKLRFKSYLLLQDVTEDQAPFVYVMGSHRDERWRRRWDWGYHDKETAGAVLDPEDVRRICLRFGYEERTFTGKAGDLIIADTRGIHRGNVLRRGTRLQLVNLNVMNGPTEYAS